MSQRRKKVVTYTGVVNASGIINGEANGRSSSHRFRLGCGLSLRGVASEVGALHVLNLKAEYEYHREHELSTMTLTGPLLLKLLVLRMLTHGSEIDDPVMNPGKLSENNEVGITIGCNPRNRETYSGRLQAKRSN